MKKAESGGKDAEPPKDGKKAWNQAISAVQATSALKLDDDSPAIKVCIRVRPFIREELEGDRAVGGDVRLCIQMPTTTQVVMTREGDDPRSFDFDRCYWSHNKEHPLYADQQTLQEELGECMLEKALAGFNNCIFAYGQTGSGKSFSVLGGTGEARGLLPRVVEGLFRHLAAMPAGTTCKTIVAFLEIYNEQIRDLLAQPDPTGKQQKLDVKQHPVLGTIVPGLTEAAVGTCQEVLDLVDYGTNMRQVSATAMNATSSRSHCIFTFKTSVSASGGQAKMSQTHFVDLAGSERAGRTKATGDRLKEGASINQSLSTLARCISELAKKKGKKGNPPFRDSRLTYILKESLAGNSKTVMMAAISPSECDYEETLSTMKFAQSAKQVSTKAVANSVNEKGVEEALRRELEELRAQLRELEAQKDPGPEVGARHSVTQRRFHETEQLCVFYGTDWDSLLEMERARMQKRVGLKSISEIDVDALVRAQEAQEAAAAEALDDADTESAASSATEVEQQSRYDLIYLDKPAVEPDVADDVVRVAVRIPSCRSALAVTGPMAARMLSRGAGDADQHTADWQQCQRDADEVERLSAELLPPPPEGEVGLKLHVVAVVDPQDPGRAELAVRVARGDPPADDSTEWLSGEQLRQRLAWLRDQCDGGERESSMEEAAGLPSRGRSSWASTKTSSSLNAELAASREELAASEDELAHTQDKLARSQENLARSQGELAASREECAALKRELEALRGTARDESAARKRELDALKGASQDELAGSRRELDALRARMRTELAAAQDELAATKRELDAVRGSHSAALAAHQSEVAASRGELDALRGSQRAALAAHQDELTSSREDLHSQRGELEARHSELAATREEVEALRERLACAETGAADARIELAKVKQDAAAELMRAATAATAASSAPAPGERRSKSPGVNKAIAASFESAISAIDAATAALHKANVDRKRTEHHGGGLLRVPGAAHM